MAQPASHCCVIKCAMISVGARPSEDDSLVALHAFRQGNLGRRASVPSIGHAPKTHSGISGETPQLVSIQWLQPLVFKVIFLRYFKASFFYDHKW